MPSKHTFSYLILLSITCVFLSICIAVVYDLLRAEKDRVYALADALEVILNSTVSNR